MSSIGASCGGTQVILRASSQSFGKFEGLDRLEG